MFQLGDVVRLKSGSPLMTVERVEGSGDSAMIGVLWFDGKQEPHSGSYPAATLEKVDLSDY